MASDKVEHILLSEVNVNPSWNVRSGNWTDDEGTPDREGEPSNTGFKGLLESIKAQGQITPVDVRPSTGKWGKKPYDLVTGYRRFEALSRIAAEAKNKEAFVRAIVKDMTDLEARERNLLENTARDDLKGPDLAFGVFDLLQLSNNAATQEEIAKKVNKSQPYIGKLLTIMKDIKPAITKQWRDSKQIVPVNDMYMKVSKVDKDRQQEVFNSLLKASETKKPGKKGWLDAAKKRAKAIGEFLGMLERKGLIDTENLVFEESIRDCFKFKKDATEKQCAAIAAAATKAFDEAKANTEADKADEDDDDSDE